MGRGVSRLDDAYVALRDLLKAGPASSKTRESASRAVKRLYEEALARTLLEPVGLMNPDQSEPPQVA